MKTNSLKYIFPLLALLMLVSLNGCSQAPDTQPKDFQLSGTTVKFAPPEATWQQSVQQLPRATSKDKTDTLLRFTPTWPNSHLTITALGDWKYASWEESPSATADLVRNLQNQILKRSQAQITKQSETKLDGEKALTMKFTYLEESTKMYGMQLFAIHNKTFWTISMLVPDEHAKEAQAVFNHLTDTFKFSK